MKEREINKSGKYFAAESQQRAVSNETRQLAYTCRATQGVLVWRYASVHTYSAAI